MYQASLHYLVQKGDQLLIINFPCMHLVDISYYKYFRCACMGVEVANEVHNKLERQ